MRKTHRSAALFALFLLFCASGCSRAAAAEPVFYIDAATAAVVTVSDTEDTPREAEIDDWRLMLVNRWNPLPEDFEAPELTQLINGQSIDERCYPALQEMMDDCRAEGLSPLICSSFRTRETQQALYDNKVERLIAAGYDAEAARAEAGKAVAVPRTSEHELGLAVDIVDTGNQMLDETQEDTAVQRWLMENSWRYGWILRYPNDKSEITGIIYEPWHYRYVGADAAREMHDLGVCLEEYLDAVN